MQNLEVYLKEILFRFDRVVIPGLGEFISYYKPAFRDKNKHVFYPPSKHLSFTTNARFLDNLLIEEIAKKTGKNNREASIFVKEEVGKWKAYLQQNNRLEIKEIGSLFLSKTGNITFQADQTENFLMDAFGLFPVYSPQIGIENHNEVIELGAYQEAEVVEEISLSNSVSLAPISSNKNGNTLPVKWHSTFKKYKVGAAAAGLLLVPTAYFFGNTEISGDSQFSGINPFGFLNKAVYQPRSVEGINEITHEEPDNAKVIAEASTSVSNTANTVVNLKATSVNPVAELSKNDAIPAPKENIYGEINSNFKYHLINGCYKEEENATKWVVSLREKGHNAYILDKYKGLYRVAMGSFESKKLAHKEYTLLKREGVKSWILKR